MNQGGAPPQVIRRPDGSFALLNVDLEPLDNIQRIAIAVEIWDQIRWLLKIAGEYLEREPSINQPGIGRVDDIDKIAASLVEVPWSRLNKVRPGLIDNPRMRKRVLDGEFANGHELQRALGMKPKKTAEVYFGKGDKFDDVFLPVSRYLKGWEGRGFAFTHVNPKEAQKRLKILDEVSENLKKAREDLLNRSHAVTFKAPHERKGKVNG